MKHLLITLDYPPQKGGVAGYYAHLVEALSRQGQQMTVLTVGKGGTKEVIRKTLIHPLVNPHWFPLVWEVFLRRQSLDWFWAGQVLPVGTALWLLSFVSRIRYGVFCHGMDVKILSGRKKMIARWVLQRASRIVCNSRYTKEVVQGLGISGNKIQVVYPCPGIQGEVSMSQKPVLLTVCRLVERKGVDLVLRALPLIRKRVPDVRYVVSGDGPMRASWQKLAQELGVSVEWKGAVSEETLKSLYQEAQVFVMTPKEIGGDVEGFGMVYLEANSFGLPVVATKTGGVVEAVLDGKTGVFCESTPEGVAHAAIALFEDEEKRYRLGMFGRRRVMEEFSWDKQASILIQSL